MQKKIVLILATLSFFTFSCENNSLNPVEDKKNVNQFVELSSTQFLTDNMLKAKVLTKIKNESNKFSNKLLEDFNIDLATVSEYKNSEVRSIIVPLSGNYSYIVYVKDNLLSKNSLILKLTSNDKTEEVNYFTISNKNIGNIIVDNGIVTEASGFIGSISTRRDGFFDDWGDCVGDVLNKMTDGSVEGSVWGLACIAFGPECAAGTAIGCAIVSAYE